MRVWYVVVGILLAMVVLMSSVIVVRTRALDNSVSAEGLSGQLVVGLALYDGSRWHNLTAYSPRLFEYAVYSVGGISVTDPSEVRIYAVIRVDYSCGGLRSLRAEAEVKHWYEMLKRIEPAYGRAVKDLPSSDGSHTATVTVFLGTLDYIAWLSDYASRKTSVYPYPGSWDPIPPEPPACVDMYFLSWDGTLRLVGTTADGRTIEASKTICLNGGTATANFCKDTLSIAYSVEVMFANDSATLSFVRAMEFLGGE